MGEGPSSDLAVMFAKNRQANAEAQTGSAARPFGGEERIEDLRQNFTAYARAIILESGDHTICGAADANAKRAVIANFANGLLGIGDEVQENLGELAGVPQDEGKVRRSGEIHGDAVGAQGVFMKLQAALDQFTQIEANLARLRRPRKSEQTLHNLGGAAGLAMGDLELAARGIVAGGIAEEFGDAEYSSERIIELMGHAGDHLAHGRKPFVLNQLLLHALGIGGVAGGRDDAGDLTGKIHERAGGGAEQSRFAVAAAGQELSAAVGALSGNDGVQERLNFSAAVRLQVFDERRANQLFRREAQQFLGTRADKGVAPLTIESDDQIGEAFHQAPREFLFPLQARLDLTPFGDIHKSSLTAAHAPGRIANQGRGVDRGEG